MCNVLFVLLAGIFVAANASSTSAQTAPALAGLASYQEGMRQFDAARPPRRDHLPLGFLPLIVRDYSAVEKLFNGAARLGLPHADYGLACAIYASGDRDRYSEAFQHAQVAAQRGVLEAKALLISYFRSGIGTPEDSEKSKSVQEDLYDIVHGPNWPVVSGAPGTVPIAETREELDATIKDVLESGKCAPGTRWVPPLRDLGLSWSRFFGQVGSEVKVYSGC